MAPSDGPTPPRDITIKWCPECGRDDRFRPFVGKGHWPPFTQKKCTGTPVPVTYKLDVA